MFKFGNTYYGLGLKAAAFFGLLIWIKFGGGSLVLPVFLFFLLFFFFYFRPFINSRQIFWSFLILFVLSLVFITNHSLFITRHLFIISIIFGLSAAFYLVLGIKNLIFIDRQSFYFLLNNLLFFLIFLFFFAAEPRFSLVKYFLMFIVALLLGGEFLRFLVPEFSRRRVLFAAAFAFLIFQSVWVIAFLPIGFLNSAALALSFVFIFSDFIAHHLGGSLNRRLILRNITIVIIVAIVISAASQWAL